MTVERISLHNEDTTFSVCIIGDAGGAHVASRISAMSEQSVELHLLTSRPTSLNLRDVSVVDAGDGLQVPPFLKWHRAIKDSAGDVVNIHYANSWGAWVFALSGDRRAMVLTVMGGDVLLEEQSKPHPLAVWLTRLVIQRADLITVKSSHLADVLSAQGVKQDRMTRLNWGIDRSIFKPGQRASARQTMMLPKNSFVVFSPRILNSFYRIDVIVRAFAQLKPKENDVILVISEYEAEAGYKEYLEDLARSLGIFDAITFKPRMTAIEMATMYQSSDVVVGIPPSDGFPLTILEAMACEVPNIVTPLKTYREMLVANDNVIFALPNPENLATAMIQLRENDQLRDGVIQGGVKFLEGLPNLDQSASSLIAYLMRFRKSNTHNQTKLFTRCLGWFVLLGFSLRYCMSRRHAKRQLFQGTGSGVS